MMRFLRMFLVPLAGAWLFLPTCVAADEPTPAPGGLLPAWKIQLPAGFDPATAAALKRPDSPLRWKVAPVLDEMPVYARPDDDTPAAVEKGQYGEVYYVAATSRQRPNSLLIGKFGARGQKLERLAGWVDPQWVFDRDQPLSVAEARDYLTTVIGLKDARRAWIENALPEGVREAGRTTPLKALVHRERGRKAYFRPVPMEDGKEPPADVPGQALFPGGIYYVQKLVVHEQHAYCLLSHQPQVSLHDNDAKRDSQLLGWVCLENLNLWPTRQTALPNYADAAFVARKATNSPLEFWPSRSALEAGLRGLSVDEKGRPARPVSREDLGRAPRPTPATSLGWPILDSYPLRGDLRGLQMAPLAYVSRTKGRPAPGLSEADFTQEPELQRDLETIRKITQHVRRTELTLVLDTTGSMKALFPDILRAMVKLVDELRQAEASRSPLERIELFVTVVGYKDLGDTLLTDPPLNEESPRKPDRGFFAVNSKAEFERFQSAVLGLQPGGGGDDLEYPFAGVRTAVRSYLSPGPHSHHLGSANRMIVLFGDHGNHDKDDKNYLWNVEDVAGWMEAVGDGDQLIAGTMFNAVFVELAPGHKCSHWDAQMPELARRTRGTHHVLPYHEARRAEAPEALRKHLKAVLEARRAAVLDAIKRWGASFAPTDTGEGDLAVDPKVLFIDQLAKETVSPEELKRIRANLSRSFFMITHAVEKYPGEPEPRMRLNVLLTHQELITMQAKTYELAQQLEAELKRDGGPVADPATAYKRMVVRSLLVVMGDLNDVPPDELRKWERLPLSVIQRKVGQVPVPFGCLDELSKRLTEDEGKSKKLTADEEKQKQLRTDVEALRDLLMSRAGGLRAILRHAEGAHRTENRFVEAAPGATELHILLKPEELP